MLDVQYTRQLVCMGCGSRGEANADAKGPFTASEPFYLRAPRRLEGPPEIICGHCGSFHRRLRPDLP